MKPTIFVAILFVFLICVTCEQANSGDNNKTYVNEILQTSKAETMPEDCTTLKFRYLIIDDSMVTPNTRNIEVFLDDKAFNEENLKALFRFLSDKNPDPNELPNNLMVFVKTDWNQMPFSSDCPPSGFSGGDAGKDRYDYHWANFYRRQGKESFVYNPTKKVWKDKDVIMKGNKIFANGKWQEPK